MKEQITISAAVCMALGTEAGDRDEFVQTRTGQFEPVAATQSVTSLKGVLHKPQTTVSIQQMNNAIAEQGGRCERPLHGG